MNNRICPQEEVLSAYLSGSLSEEEREKTERHLAGCGNCRKLVVETHEVVKTLKFSEFKGAFWGWIKKNRWFIGALTAFIASFFFPKYFLQLLAACVLMGGKWIVEARTAKILIMIYEAWKQGDKETTDKILSRLDSKKFKS